MPTRGETAAAVNNAYQDARDALDFLESEAHKLVQEVYHQQQVIEAAREFGPCWLSPGKPCGECLVCKLNRSLAALEGKME